MSEENKHLTPSWIIYVDGKRLDTDHEGALLRIRVSDRLNGIGKSILLFDTSAVKLRDAGSLSLESQVSIHLGYKDNVKEVFDGEITAFNARFPENGAEELEVTCSNALYKLRHSCRFSSFADQKTSDILSDIISGYGLTADVETFGVKLPFTAEYALNDYEYVLKTAALYGRDVYAYGSKVYIKDEISVKTDQIVFEWGKSLISFSACEDIQPLISGVTYTGWDNIKCSGFTGTAAMSDVRLKVGGSSDWTALSKGGGGYWESLIVDQGLADAADAKEKAIGSLQRNSFLFASATGKAEGTNKLFPGMRVSVKYVGETYSGEYITDSVHHRFDRQSGYTTEFTLKRNMSP